jgi:hypothetical protein
MEACVVTDMKNGIGNILSEIMVGLFFSKKLSTLTGDNYKYYALLTDKCMKGHEILYNKYHSNNELPHPLNLSAVFPHIDFLVRLPENMHTIHYLGHVDITSFEHIKRLNIIVDSVTQPLMNLGENKDILSAISFSDKITKYTIHKYAPTNKSMAIHIRLPQIGDYMNVKCAEFQWYKNTIWKYIEMYGNPDKIFIITGISTAKNKYSKLRDELFLYLESLNIKIINVIDEPYYIDLSIISVCGIKIIDNSSFSLFASLIDLTDDKIVFYPPILAEEFKIYKDILPNLIKSI